MSRRILAAVALFLCTVCGDSVEEEPIQGLASWDLQIIHPAKHDPVSSIDGTVSVELELRGAVGIALDSERLLILVNSDVWSLWTAASCESMDGRCTLHLHLIRPGPIRLSVALLDAGGYQEAEASVFFLCDATRYRHDLLARNPWIQDHTWQRRRRAVTSVNLAYRGEAHQQSTAFSAHAGLAVDGRIESESDLSAGFYTHTAFPPPPGDFGEGLADVWWTVALRGGMGRVRSVTIYNRRDCRQGSEHLRGFRVFLSNESLTAALPTHADEEGESGGFERRLSDVLEMRGGEGVVECGETSLLSEEDLAGPIMLDCPGTLPPNVHFFCP